MLFREATGDPEVDAIHRDLAAQSKAALLPMIAQEKGSENVSDGRNEMTWEVIRGTDFDRARTGETLRR